MEDSSDLRKSPEYPAVAIRHAQQMLLLRILVTLASVVTALGAVIVAALVALAQHIKFF